MQDRAEVAVVGAGIVGLAAADALARAGVDVRLLRGGRARERPVRRLHARLPPRPRPGGSRRARRRCARRGWDEWSERAGESLIGDEGVLFASPDAEDLAALLAEPGSSTGLVDEEEQRRLLASARAPWRAGSYDVRGGIHARRRGGTGLRGSATGSSARRSVRRPEGVVETAPRARGRFERVLVCAGAEHAELAAPLGVELPLEIRDHTRVTFRVREDTIGSRAGWTERTSTAPPSTPAGRRAAWVRRGPCHQDAGPQRVRGPHSRLCRTGGTARPGSRADRDPHEAAHILPWHPDAFAVWEAGAALVFAATTSSSSPRCSVSSSPKLPSGRVPPELRPPGRPSA
jgi:glycine/D-amino acid oxidase-like deaminating enzyme